MLCLSLVVQSWFYLGGPRSVQKKNKKKNKVVSEACRYFHKDGCVTLLSPCFKLNLENDGRLHVVLTSPRRRGSYRSIKRFFCNEAAFKTAKFITVAAWWSQNCTVCTHSVHMQGRVIQTRLSLNPVFCLKNKTYIISTSWSSDLGSWYQWPKLHSCIKYTINCSYLCPYEGGRVDSSSSSHNFWSPPARNILHWENLYTEIRDLCCGHDCFKPVSFSCLNWFFWALFRKKQLDHEIVPQLIW